MRLSLRYLDCCLPDFFQGYSGTTFAVPVTGSDRVHEVRSALQERIDAWDGHIASLGRDATEQEADELYQAAHEMFTGHPFATCFPKMPKATEYGEGETPYAYFGLVVDA
jgi:hypothetical protein